MSVTQITETFFEFEIDITPTSTTVSGDHVMGATNIAVADVSGFTVNSTCKVGGNYYRIVAIDTGNNVFTFTSTRLSINGLTNN